MTEPPGHKPLVVNVIIVVVGPFEEEETGTGIASHVFKVQSEDPDTTDYLRGDSSGEKKRTICWPKVN